MGDIVIEEINYKAFVMVTGSVLLLIASVALMIFGIQKDRSSYWVPGIMASFLFLIIFTATSMKAMKVRKLLTITHEGIVDNSSLGGLGFISFDDIKEFLIVKVYNKRAIAVIPKDIESLLTQFSVVKRRLIKRNMNLNLPPILIMVDLAKDMEPEDILSLLNKRLLDYSSLFE
ncbi:MAG: hypothetical protein H6Q59_516 [Firmicutes bacterium]|nr:hypothetical protein [Bacillota bacterium]